MRRIAVPAIPGAHINATVTAVAEKASDLIIDERPETGRESAVT